MLFIKGHPVKPESTPHLIEQNPICSECYVEVLWDDGSYICPECGTAFDPSNSDEPGTPYPKWSGESYPNEGDE